MKNKRRELDNTYQFLEALELEILTMKESMEKVTELLKKTNAYRRGKNGSEK